MPPVLPELLVQLLVVWIIPRACCFLCLETIAEEALTGSKH